MNFVLTPLCWRCSYTVHGSGASSGRAARGERLIDKSPHGHWQTTTLIAALGIGGILCSTVVDGAVNGDIFEAFIEHVLVAELKPGDVVVMDNLSSHKRQRTRELIEAVGAELAYLPPYSPDLNPIEMVFSKIKECFGVWRIARRTHCGNRCRWCSMRSRQGTASIATNTADIPLHLRRKCSSVGDRDAIRVEIVGG
ncbi:MAG: IS630 family transposase [bacterium]|nr:IS630 family transposase [bacterium]